MKKLLFLLAMLGFSTQALAAFDAPAFFEKKCSSCHKVGGGDDVGPDLKGVETRRSEDWIIKMVQSSQSLIGSGDPIASGLFAKFKNKKMPDHDVSAEDVRKLIAFIKAGGPVEQAVDAKPATAATAADIQMGRELYLGKRALAKGGPACVSCHSVGAEGPLGGGSLAVDLTNVYSRYDDKSLSKTLLNFGFPVMQEVFADHPLTPDEAFAIKGFLFQADRQGYQGGGFQKKFLFLGLGGSILLLGFIDLSWRKRRKQSAKPTRGGLS